MTPLSPISASDDELRQLFGFSKNANSACSQRGYHRDGLKDCGHGEGSGDWAHKDKARALLDDEVAVLDDAPESAKAIDRYTKTIGANSILVASLLDSLGNIYVRKKDYKAAESAYKRSLTIKEKSLGRHSEFLIVTLESYAKLLQAVSRAQEAEDCLTRAENIRKTLAAMQNRQSIL